MSIVVVEVVDAVASCPNRLRLAVASRCCFRYESIRICLLFAALERDEVAGDAVLKMMQPGLGAFCFLLPGGSSSVADCWPLSSSLSSG